MQRQRAGFIAAWVTMLIVLTSWAPAVAGDEKVPQKNPRATIKTSLGEITVELDREKAPVSTQNFLEYARSGYYDGTIFHRVIGNFMIQGGGLTKELEPKPGLKPPIKNEADNGLKNRKYTIAMARLPAPNSATSQFFINVADNGFLDHRNNTPQGYGYAVFGKVIRGQDVVDRIKEVPTTTRGRYADVPVEPVVIESVTIEE